MAPCLAMIRNVYNSPTELPTPTKDQVIHPTIRHWLVAKRNDICGQEQSPRSDPFETPFILSPEMVRMDSYRLITSSQASAE
ncbi:unnamed protein product [Larinioides sclopetarius]|uniref:Uncharacterized protein n=1 Tax=Larinioides sclopetarius TaxID=280406 RepID=A0AAV2BRQ1_9ARAC